MNEAAARIKINKQLEGSGWRFFAEGGKPANICLEVGTWIKEKDLNDLGDDFEKTSKGYIDFLLLNEKSFPFIVLEAKSEGKDPLEAKEQARKYARSQNCNARAVFDYFVGYKLGLTATPRDFLKNFDQAGATTSDPRELERRLMLDTYRMLRGLSAIGSG